MIIAKAWNYILSWLGKEQKVVIVAPPTAQSTIVTFEQPKYKARISIYLLAHNQIQNSLDFADIHYGVASQSTTHSHSSLSQSSDLISQQQQIIDQIRELNNRVEAMSISDRQLRSAQQKCIKYDPNRYRTSIRQEITESMQRAYYREYRRDIEEHLQLKYTRQRAQFPLISFEDYVQVRSVWGEKKKGASQIKKTGLQSVIILNYKALGGIDHGSWLNDDVINIYLQLLEKMLGEGTEFKILNSYFATTTLTKTENMIQRQTKKKNITKESTIIMPINNRNHWYFAKFQQGDLMVYDSIRHQASYYLQNKIFKDALKFSRWFLGQEASLKVSQQYPQQNNQYDCGVFMLLGIRDTLLQKEWSFDQGDMRYKRVQIAHEVLNVRLAFGQQ